MDKILEHTKIFIKLTVWLICTCQLALAIQVSGDVWGTWGADDNPYQVVGELRVPPESTLVIEPGCYIDFQGHYKLIVDTLATLQAIGTETDSITFTTIDTLVGWHAIRFLNAGSDCELSFCIVEWGKADTVEDLYRPDNQGGGIYCYGTDLTISHCLIRKNKANVGKGGGIFCSNSNVVISDNYIDSNQSAFGGAGIWSEYSEVSITNNTIRENGTYYPLGGEEGGGITCKYSSVLISSNIIFHNWSYFICGGVLIYHCTASVEFNIIDSNQALDTGGGIIVIYSPAVITYNVITNNSALGGNTGGLGFGSLNIGKVANNSIYGNYARLKGGGIVTSLEYGDTLVNNIIWDNEAGEYPEIYLFGDSSNVLYNDIQGGFPAGEGNIDVDPLFRDPDNGDFHLMATYCGDPYDSPCIDAGHPDILDSLLDCSWGLGTILSDMGAYGGGDSVGVGIDDQFPHIPNQFALAQNYPNPFNALTTIKYNLLKTSDVTIDIYDILGRKVETLISARQQAGSHSIIWNAKDFSSGIYFYRITADDFSQSRKMILLK